MNRIDRLNAILIFIQGRRRTEIRTLEERFGVGRRTLFRDVRALIEGGVPIGGDAGEGYFIVEGYHLPPVVFNKEEAAAILTGFKLVERHADSKTSQTFSEALDKIKSVLKYRDKEFLEKIDDQISISQPPSRMLEPVKDLHLEELQYVLATDRVIEISYQTPYGEETTRVIEPLGLINYSSKWHLVAYCRLRTAMRNFRTDRILKIHLTNETFDPKAHPNYLEYMEDTLSVEDLIEVKVSFAKMVGKYIGDQKYYFGLVEEKMVDDRLEMKFYVQHLDYFARWLLSFGNQVRILGPSELNARMNELILELQMHHEM